jgi:hypothetical protein
MHPQIAMNRNRWDLSSRCGIELAAWIVDWDGMVFVWLNNGQTTI